MSGVSQTWAMLIICRAFQGFVLAAFFPPSRTMILGRTYRPRLRKNSVFSIYGACAALGFFVGIFLLWTLLVNKHLTWRLFFFRAILSAVTSALSFLSIPRDNSEMRELGTQMDWSRACLSIPAAGLIVFAIADSSYAPQGWRTPNFPL